MSVDFFWQAITITANNIVVNFSKFFRFHKIAGNPTSLGSNYLFCINEDRFGNLLIGTWNSGLDVLVREESKFIVYKKDTRDTGCISDNSVTSIVRDRENTGIIWIGTMSGGLIFSLNMSLPIIIRPPWSLPLSVSSINLFPSFQWRMAALF